MKRRDFLGKAAIIAGTAAVGTAKKPEWLGGMEK